MFIYTDIGYVKTIVTGKLDFHSTIDNILKIRTCMSGINPYSEGFYLDDLPSAICIIKNKEPVVKLDELIEEIIITESNILQVMGNIDVAKSYLKDAITTYVMITNHNVDMIWFPSYYQNYKDIDPIAYGEDHITMDESRYLLNLITRIKGICVYAVSSEHKLMIIDKEIDELLPIFTIIDAKRGLWYYIHQAKLYCFLKKFQISSIISTISHIFTIKVTKKLNEEE